MTKTDQTRIDPLLSALLADTDTILPGSMPPGAEGDGLLDAALAAAAPDATPPADLFDRITAGIDGPDADASGIDGVTTIRAADGTWHDRGQGVWQKPLARSPDGKAVYLLRCLPGAVLRAHHHGDWEYALVLEGRFHIAGRAVNRGDSQLSAANSDHAEITTDTGCLLLVVA